MSIRILPFQPRQTILSRPQKEANNFNPFAILKTTCAQAAIGASFLVGIFTAFDKQINSFFDNVVSFICTIAEPNES